MKQDLYTIQEVSSLLEVSPKTLRRWEQTGIIKPIRTAGNQRRYRLEDVKKLERRRSLQKVKQTVKNEIASIPLPQNIQPLFSSQPSVPQIFPEPKLPVAARVVLQSVNQDQEEVLKDHPDFRRFVKPLIGASAGFIALLAGALLWQTLGYPGLHAVSQKAIAMRAVEKGHSVLGAADGTPAFQLEVNMPGIFGKKVTFLDSVDIRKALSVKGLSQLNGGVKTNGADINAGKGKLTASNVLYSVLAGSNITISGDKQNPTISAGVTGVSSLQGTTGALVLTNGTGIGINGLTITNTGVTSVQGSTGDVTFTGGDGIGIDGTTISNTDPGSAQNIFKTITAGGTDIVAANNNDQVSFAAGSGVTVTGDASNNTITIASTGGGGGSLSGLTTNGVLYATDATDASTTTPGTDGQILIGATGGAPAFANLTPGAGIGITNGAGSVTIANNGVLSLTGTADQVNVSAATGAITLTLPQSIAATSTPSFASLTLSASTNQLVLGSGNTATITTATLGSGRTYTLPDGSGTFCLVELSNCSGGGGSLGGSGTTNFVAKFSSATGLTDSSIFDNGKVGIGTVSPQGLFSVSGGVGGLALVNLNETGSDNILVGSASGTTRFVFDASGDLNIIGGSYQIGGASVLSSTTLGSSVINSSLTSVGALNGGSITSGFGAIDVGTDSISGGDLTAVGTTGFTANGNGAGLTFSGTSNHLINASSGTLELGATTLTGDITGNNKNLTGLNNLSAGGTVTFSAFTSNGGPIYTNGSGQLFQTAAGTTHQVLHGGTTPSFGAVDLASADVTGTLPIGNGGTNTASIGSAGTVVYSNGSAYSFSAVGTSGQALISGGAGTPSWFAPTQGSLIFAGASGALSQSNSQLFFESTNNLLGVGTATPIAKLDVEGLVAGKALSIFNYTGTDQNILVASKSGTTEFAVNNNGNLQFTGNSSFVNTLTTNVTAARTYTFPNTTGTICLVEAGNCAGSGTGVTTPGGTANRLVKFTAPQSVGNASINDLFSGGVAMTIDVNGNAGIGTATPLAPLQVNGAFGGNAAAIINQLNPGDIFAASASGATKFVVTNNGSIEFNGNSGFLQTLTSTAAVGKTYNFPTFAGSTADICLTTGNCAGTGGGITGSGTSGQIAFFNGAGTITSETTGFAWDTTNKKLGIGNDTPVGKLDLQGAVTGKALAIFNETGDQDIFTASASGATEFTIARSGDITAIGNGIFQGTTGLSLSGAGAGLTYSGSGNHSISAPSGTLELGATTLTGDITGNNKNLTGLNNLSAGGTVTFSAFTSNGGPIYTNGSGQLFQTAAGTTHQVLHGGTTPSFGAVDLASADVTGTLGVTSGGTGLNTITTGDLLYGSSANTLSSLSIGTNGQILSVSSGLPAWISSSSINFWQRANGELSPLNITDDLLLGATATTSARFAFMNVAGGIPVASVSAGLSGATYLTAAGTVQTTADQNLTIGGSSTGNITLSPLNGSGTVTSTGTFSLASGKTYQINGVDVLSATTLGSSVVNSSLTSVGALVTGSIASGFGTISTSNTITGTTLNGTTGINTGAGGGTNRIDSSGDLLNIVNTTTSGTVQFSHFTTGIAHLDSTGNLTSSAVDLATTDVANTLGSGNGGTGFNTYATGDLLYGNGGSTLSKLTIGSAGQVLGVSGGIPAWIATSSLNFWQRASGALSPLNVTDDLLLGGTSTASAKFAVLNMAGGTPVASVAGNFIVMPYTSGAGQLGGNVGIGTTSPGSILDVNAGSVVNGGPRFLGTSSDVGVQLVNSGTNGVGWFLDSTSNGTFYGPGNLSIFQVGLGGNPALTFTNPGNFGGGGYGIGINPKINDALHATLDIRNGRGTLATASVSGATSFASLVTDNSGIGDLFTASKSGASKFTVLNNGNVQINNLGTGVVQSGGTGIFSSTALNLAGGASFISGQLPVGNGGTGQDFSGVAQGAIPFFHATGVMNTLAAGSTGQCLETQGAGADPIWAPCAQGTNFWQENLGALAPANITDDLLLGGTSTASARFAFLNNAGGTPTASISANTANNNTYLTGTGFLGTTNRQTLTLGNSSSFNTTGNILINSNGVGVVEIGNTSAQTGAALDVTGVLAVDGTSAGLNLYSRNNDGGSSQLYSAVGGDLNFFLNNNIRAYLSSGGRFAIGLGNTNPRATLDVQGTSINGGTVPIASFSGSTSFAGMVVDQSGTGDLFTASKSGATKFVIGNNGTFQTNGATAIVGYNRIGTNGTGITANGFLTNPNDLLVTGKFEVLGSLQVDSNLIVNGTQGTVGWFQRNAGALEPANITDDLLLGGTSTASARFAFLNNAGGTPTASISAQTGGASAGLALSPGAIQSLNKGTLTVGGTTTGDISFQPGGQAVGNSLYLTSGGSVGIGTTSPNVTLDVVGTIGVDTLNVRTEMYGFNCGSCLNYGVLEAVSTGGSIPAAQDRPLKLQLSGGSGGLVSIGPGLSNSDPLATLDVRGANGTLPIASFSGATSFASLVTDNSGSGDLFTASKSGATKFVIGNNGTFQTNGATAIVGYNRIGTNGTGITANGFLTNPNDLLVTGKFEVLGSLQVDSNLIVNGTQGTVGWFQRNNGALLPANITDDLLLGGSATTSARFAFTGNAGNATPVASISANPAIGTGTGLSFNGNGTIQSLNNNTLTIGGNSTGNIQFKPGNSATSLFLASNGNVGIGTTTPGSALDVNAGSTVNGGERILGTSSDVGLQLNNSGTGGVGWFFDSAANGTFVGAGNLVISQVGLGGNPAMSFVNPANNGGGGYAIGINQTIFDTLHATLDVRSGKGTVATASFSGATSFASLLTDNSGSGDLFVASKSGATKFVIDNNGDVGIGVLPQFLIPGGPFSSPVGSSALDNVGGNLVASGAIQSGEQNGANEGVVALLPGGNNLEGTSGQIDFYDQPGNSLGFVGSNGAHGGFEISPAISDFLAIDNKGFGNNLTSVAINTDIGGANPSTPLATLDVRGNVQTTAIASFSGKTTFAGLVVDNSGTGDLFTASSAGKTKFLIQNSGNVFIGGDTISANSSGATNTGSPAFVNALGDEGSLVPNAGFEANVSNSVLGDGWVRDGTSSATMSNDTTDTPESGNAQAKITETNTTSAIYSACIPIGGTAGNYTLNWYQKGTSPFATVEGFIDTYASKANCQSNTSVSLSAIAGEAFTTAAWARAGGGSGVVTLTTGTWGRVHMIITCPSSCTSSVTFLDGVRLTESGVGQGLDYAENYPADPNNVPVAGQVVSLLASGSAALVTPSNKYMDASVIGVVSTNPGQVLDDGSVPDPKVPIALAGRVPVNVSTLNGPIHVGDYLTSSTIPGVAVKATAAGPVIGTAMEDDTDTDTTAVKQITVFVKNSYYSGLTITDTGNLSIFQNTPGIGDTTSLLTQGPTYGIKDSSGNMITQQAAFSDAAIGNLKAGGIDAQHIATEDLILAGQSVGDRLNSLEAATASAAQLSNRIDTVTNGLNSLDDKVASLEATFNLLASGSALLNGPTSFIASSAAELGLDKLTANNAIITNDLSVLGKTTVADLGVTGRVTIGLLGINGLDASAGSGQAFASINTSSGPFKIQSEGLNGVDFENGKLTIATDGSLKTQATIIAKEIKTDKLNIIEDTQSSPSAVLSSSAGTVTIPAGDSSIDVNTSALTAKSLIFVTPDQPVVVGAKAIAANTFRITVKQTQSNALKISWWIVN